MLNLVSLAGWLAFAGLAWALGGCRRPLPWRTIAGCAALVFGLGALVFVVPPSRRVLLVANDAILALLSESTRGAVFLFGPLALSPGETTPAGEPSIGFVLAAQVLPAVIFFASLMALLYHLGWIQPVVKAFGRLFHRTLALSGAEALAGSLHMFFGVETAAAIRPYLKSMTRSELLTVMTANLATVASTTLAIYVLFLRDAFPQIAGHLLSASLLSIPCTVLVAKLMLPETTTPETLGAVPPLAEGDRHESSMGALAAGALDGVKVAAAISAILIAVLGVVGVADLLVGRAAELLGAESPIGIAQLLGFAFTPFAWLLGIDPADLGTASRLLGQRLVLTEVVSYQELGAAAATGALSERTVLVLSYALCGFAHVGGMAIAVGGFAALAPSRLEALSALALRALAAATLATLMTGAIAGIFYHGQVGVLGL